jgi:hypothetical protein
MDDPGLVKAFQDYCKRNRLGRPEVVLTRYSPDRQKIHGKTVYDAVGSSGADPNKSVQRVYDALRAYMKKNRIDEQQLLEGGPRPSQEVTPHYTQIMPSLVGFWICIQMGSTKPETGDAPPPRDYRSAIAKITDDTPQEFKFEIIGPRAHHAGSVHQLHNRLYFKGHEMRLGYEEVFIVATPPFEVVGTKGGNLPVRQLRGIVAGVAMGSYDPDANMYSSKLCMRRIRSKSFGEVAFAELRDSGERHPLCTYWRPGEMEARRQEEHDELVREVVEAVEAFGAELHRTKSEGDRLYFS